MQKLDLRLNIQIPYQPSYVYEYIGAFMTLNLKDPMIVRG